MRDVLMPSMGESVMAGVIINVLVKPGDLLLVGQTLIEVETDKVTFEVPAEESGKIEELFAKTGDQIHPGELILKINSEIENVKELIDANDINLDDQPPDMVNDPLTTLKKYFDKQTDQISVVENGKLLEKQKNKILSSPLARKLARELGIEISDIGKGLNNRISLDDVKRFAKSSIKQLQEKSIDNRFEVSRLLPDFSKFGDVSRKAMSAIMIATSRNMVNSINIIPHAWIEEKVDFTNIELSRKKHKAQVAAAGGSLTVTALVIKGVTSALQAFPVFNASLDNERKEIVFKSYINIGVAVDTGNGLLVPVIRDAQQRNLTNIAIDLMRISKDAKDRKTKLEDLEGATFTISNLGGIGTTGMNPIIDWPQVAILGLSAGQIEATWEEKQFVPHLKIPLILGFDHRVINGADAARFLQYLKTLLEDPFLLLL